MSRLAYVGEALTLTRDAVLLDLPAFPGKEARYAAARRELPFASIEEVSVFDHELRDGARLVVASPEIVLAKDFPEVPLARQACRVIIHAMNRKGVFTRSQRMRGQHPTTGGPVPDRGRS